MKQSQSSCRPNRNGHKAPSSANLGAGVSRFRSMDTQSESQMKRGNKVGGVPIATAIRLRQALIWALLSVVSVAWIHKTQT
jgi:hypothetical protein